MNALSVQLRVTSVRSRGKFGGVIFAGQTDVGDRYVAVCSHKLLPDASLVDKGQHWAIQGVPFSRESMVNGYRHNETQIEATFAELIRPSGRNVIAWIAECPDCAGIGKVKATKLYDRFGPALIELIERKEAKPLAEILGADAAEVLCEAFVKHKVADTLLWLDRLGIPHRIGQKVAKYYRDEARSRVEANPYVLIPFEADWNEVDALARARFSILIDDPRRIESAIEETLYRGYRHGHTCLPRKGVRTALARLLGATGLADQALSIDAGAGQYHCVGGYLQASGAFLIEQFVAQRLSKICAGSNEGGQFGLFAPLTSNPVAVEAAIAVFERDQSVTLSPEQRAAVLTSLGTHLSLILGGAGTGKTTVLKALYATLEQIQPGVAIYQLALAGKAAQRMAEVTGRDAMTIAGFLVRIDSGQIAPGSLVVVDETSIVDIILMYRLLRHMPPDVRLILVGDPSQLPPIGPGLVLHVLAAYRAVPKTELHISRRQSAESGIPAVADAVRVHRVPQFAEYQGLGAGVSFVRCDDVQIEGTVRRVYGELHGDASDYAVQVLSITNAGYGGVQSINMAFHNEFRTRAPLVYSYDPFYGRVGAQTLERVPLRVGDLVMYTENDYNLGLRNGALGMVVEGFEPADVEAICCVCEFEGIRYPLNSRQTNALRHSYSITVYKSQGSQFRRVILSIRKSRLLDQALIYTGLTRGIEQVVLIGDWDAMCAAILAPATAAKRYVSLPRFLDQAFEHADPASL